MFNKKLLIGTLIAFVFIFMLDYLWYGLLMGDFFTRVSGVDREMPLFPFLILGTLIMAYAFCALYVKGFDNNKSLVSQGINHGILVCLLMFIPLGLIVYGVQEQAPLSEYLVDMVFRIIQFVVLGIIIAKFFGVNPERPGRTPGGGD